jgi:secreted trypsin-like serine protease
MTRGGQRIVGGTEAAPGAWPWAAAMTFRSGTGYFQYCGGALIAGQWVLTAAHCEVEVGDTIILGRHDLRTSAGEEIRVDRVLTHRDYDPGTNDNDISLVHLERASGQATLPLGEDDIFAGEPVTVIGWGLTSEGGAASSALRQVSVPVVSQEDCAEAYVLTPNMICAGFPEGGRDSCQGDSGGPLMALIGETWAHVGIVSFGEGCARPNRPGVYTRTSRYVDWIEECAQ